MNFRDHPLVSYRGMRSWPPIWIQMSAPYSRSAIKTLRGEIGVLKRVVRHQDIPNECFLVIEHGEDSWMGTLLIDNGAFCAQIAAMLQFYVGHSIKEIGGIDLGFTL